MLVGLDLQRENMELTRTITLDAFAFVSAKSTRFLAVAALLTLGKDRAITAAVRELTPNVTVLVEKVGARKVEFDRLTTRMEKALESFRAKVDSRLTSNDQADSGSDNP